MAQKAEEYMVLMTKHSKWQQMEWFRVVDAKGTVLMEQAVKTNDIFKNVSRQKTALFRARCSGK
jgi:monomeric isocitrate dehydrogenase